MEASLLREIIIKKNEKAKIKLKIPMTGASRNFLLSSFILLITCCKTKRETKKTIEANKKTNEITNKKTIEITKMPTMSTIIITLMKTNYTLIVYNTERKNYKNKYCK